MATGSKEAIDAIVVITKEMKLKKKMTEISYRSDYEDYQVIFDETHHCEINASTINDFMSTKNGDLKREIQFRLNHLIAFEEWDKPVPPGQREEKIQVDEEL